MRVLFHAFDFVLVGMNLLEDVIIVVNDDLRWFNVPGEPVLGFYV